MQITRQPKTHILTRSATFGALTRRNSESLFSATTTTFSLRRLSFPRSHPPRSSPKFTTSPSELLLGFARSRRSMALTNFILTVAGVGAVVLMLRSDVRQSASIFKRNVKHIRTWLEEESPKITKELESKVPPKDIPKDKH
ncbi:uncharacterized protein [Malus domestica]|uniref:uncharacterized protein n=1 Tax=Malus domestica TaxID=3750 RepID=UPI003976E46C